MGNIYDDYSIPFSVARLMPIYDFNTDNGFNATVASASALEDGAILAELEFGYLSIDIHISEERNFAYYVSYKDSEGEWNSDDYTGDGMPADIGSLEALQEHMYTCLMGYSHFEGLPWSRGFEV